MHAEHGWLPERPGDPRFPSEPSPLVYVLEELHREHKRIEQVLDGQAAPTEEDLNALGEAGWELVGILSYRDRVYLYFKRLIE
jgi:hypothetical protein